MRLGRASSLLHHAAARARRRRRRSGRPARPRTLVLDFGEPCGGPPPEGFHTVCNDYDHANTQPVCLDNGEQPVCTFDCSRGYCPQRLCPENNGVFDTTRCPEGYVCDEREHASFCVPAE